MRALRQHRHHESWQTVFANALFSQLLVSSLLTPSLIHSQFTATSPRASGASGVGTVLATIPVGAGPTTLSYDPVDKSIFVANSGGSISVIDGSSLQLKTTIPLPAPPIDMSYDNTSDEVYVVGAKGIVSAIGGGSDVVVDNLTIAVTSYPSQNDLEGVTYDFRNHDLYVTALKSTNVTLVDSVSNRISGSISTNCSMTELRYDPENRLVYALDSFQGQGICVLNSTTSTMSSYISEPVMAVPQDVLFNFESDEVFIVNEFLRTIWVLNGTTDQLIRSFPVSGFPLAAAFDSWNNRLYITTTYSPYAEGAGNVSIINVTSGSTVGRIQVGNSPYGIAFDSGTGMLYAANWGSNDVSVISPNATNSSGEPPSEFLWLLGNEGYAVLSLIIIAAAGVVIFTVRRKSKGRR